MFGLEWSKKSTKAEESISFDCYSDDLISNIDEISPLMWGEHCLECAVPECYGNCKKYSARKDKRCKRFANGIEKVPHSKGALKYAVKVSFLEWGKLESLILPTTMKYKKLLRLNRFFDFSTSIAKAIPTYYPRRFLYLAREYIARRKGKKNGNLPQMLLAEFINPGEPYNLILESKTNEKTLYRTSLTINPGFNRFMIPFSELKYDDTQRTMVSLFPENDKIVDVYICTLDLVTLKKPVSECIQLPKIKCVVWDLDNTIWDGILSENDNVALRNDAINAIKELDKRGILNSVASKNNFDEAKKKLCEFGIDEYFLAMQINWGMKSSSIKKIAKILDIGIDTFAFVDDMAYEREEVRHALPLVRTFDANNINELLSSPDVDAPITEASATRRQSYIDIANRNSEMESFDGSLVDFIKTCEIKVKISKPCEDEYNRCHELIQRTNQLNLSGERLSYDELTTIFNSDTYLSQAIRVKDKYGDYGLVGVAIYKISDGVATLNHFVLSCRAARKLVEQSYFDHMVDLFKAKNISKLVIKCAITEKNSLLRSSIEDFSNEQIDHIDQSHYTITVDCNTHNSKYNSLMQFE